MKKITKFFSALLLTLSVSSCEQIGPSSVDTGFDLLTNSTWIAVDNVNELQKGDRLIIAYGNKAMGHLNNNEYQGVQTGFDAVVISDTIAQFELGGAQGSWTFKTYKGKYLSYSSAELSESKGSVTWTVDIDNDGSATISSTEDSERYLAYSTDRNIFKLSKSLFKPTLYRGLSNEDVYPTRVSISGSDKVAVNNTVQLTANFEPSTTNKRGVRWSVDNDTLASIDSTGLLTGKAVGNVKVTVASTDVENVSAQFDVEVVQNNIPVTSVTLDKSSVSMTTEQQPLQLTATVLPTNATDKTLTWTSSKEGVATVSPSGLVTPVGAGTTTITAEANDGSGKYGSCSVTVTAPVDPVDPPSPVDPVTPTASGEWTLVENTSGLTVGDTYVIAYEEEGYVAGDISTSTSKYMSTLESTFSNDGKTITKINEKALVLTLGGTSGQYTLTNASGEKLGVNGSKNNSLKWDDGVMTWNITFNNGGVSIKNTNNGYGSIQYNVSSPRFSNYTKSNQKNPQLYKGSAAEPVYPTAISISGSSELSLNQTSQLSVAYTPNDTNQKKVTWQSSDSSVVSVSNTGLITGVSEGTAIITATCLGANGENISNSLTIKVSRVAVTGVTLNATTKDVSVGKEVALTATVAPNNASNKEVTWSTADSSIANVSTTGVVTAKKIGLTTVTATTLDGGYTASCAINVVEQTKASWTVMIYMCGADLESNSQNRLATADIKEILSISNQPDDVNIIIETGGAKSWASTYSINKNYLQRWHVENKKLVLDASITKASMGQVSTFQSFLEWGLTEYPAEKTGVILWNHGGAMRGVCYDENFSDDNLLNSEVKKALGNAFTSTNQTEKLEFIGYDACLMQVQDVAEFNSQYFNYMVASEESESGYGWDYDTWIDDLYSGKSSEVIFKAIVDGFISDNGGANISSYQGYVADQTLSYLDLSKMAAYKEAWEAMAEALGNKLTSSNKSSFNTLIKSVKHFAGDDYDYFGTFDAKDFINKLQNNNTFKVDSSIANAVLTAHQNLVKYSVAQKGAGNAYGLCMFWAVDAGTDYSTSQSTYYKTSETNFSTWRTLSSTYGY